MVTEIVRFRFTTDEYEQMIAAGILTEEDRVELIEGEIIEMRPIGDDHVFAVNNLTEMLVRRLAGQAVVSIQNPIRLSGRSRPQPDIALWRPAKRRSLPGPDDILLLIEVADSTLAFDRDVKLPLYARAGIVEVWIVNLIDKRIEVYRQPAEGGYRSVEFAGQDEVVSPLSFPGVELSVEAILQ
jgi:Uma2 family endonuclease